MRHSTSLIVLLLTLALAACSPLTFTVAVTPNAKRMTTTPVMSDGRFNSPRIAVIDVSGLLVNADTPGLLDSRENPVATFDEALALAEGDRRVTAVVLRLNTPGGAVTATDIMYRELLHFRQRTGKPVVALMMDVTASGGYYLACGADRIVAYPTSGHRVDRRDRADRQRRGRAGPHRHPHRRDRQPPQQKHRLPLEHPEPGGTGHPAAAGGTTFTRSSSAWSARGGRASTRRGGTS